MFCFVQELKIGEQPASVLNEILTVSLLECYLQATSSSPENGGCSSFYTSTYFGFDVLVIVTFCQSCDGTESLDCCLAAQWVHSTEVLPPMNSHLEDTRHDAPFSHVYLTPGQTRFPSSNWVSLQSDKRGSHKFPVFVSPQSFLRSDPRLVLSPTTSKECLALNVVLNNLAVIWRRSSPRKPSHPNHYTGMGEPVVALLLHGERQARKLLPRHLLNPWVWNYPGSTAPKRTLNKLCYPGEFPTSLGA